MRLYEINEDINQVPKFYDEVSDEKWRERNDCVIVALSLICNISYEKARDALMKNGKLKNEAPLDDIIKKAIEYLGFNFRHVHPDYYLNKIPKSKRPKNLTLRCVRQFPEIFEKELGNQNQMWCLSDHAFAVIDGKIQDERGIRPNSKIYWIIDISNSNQVTDYEESRYPDAKSIINNYDEACLRITQIHYAQDEYSEAKYRMDREKAGKLLEKIIDEYYMNLKIQKYFIHVFPYESDSGDNLMIKITRDKDWNLHIKEFKKHEFRNRNWMYEDINQVPKFYDEIDGETEYDWREKGDCAIISVALLCKVSYEKASWALAKAEGQRKGRPRRFEKGRDNPTILKAINILGYDYAEVDPNYYVNKLNKLTNKRYKFLNQVRMTQHPEIFNDEPQPHNQLWGIDEHVFTCINGKVEDHMSYKTDNVECVHDVFPMGRQPMRNDESSYVKLSTNYILAVKEYARLYNNLVKDQYKIDFNQAREYLEMCIDKKATHSFQRHGFEGYEHQLNTGKEGYYIVIERDEDGNIQVYYDE